MYKTRFTGIDDRIARRLLFYVRVVTKFCVQDKHQLVGICYCGFVSSINCFINDQLSDDQGGIGKPGEVITNGVGPDPDSYRDGSG